MAKPKADVKLAFFKGGTDEHDWYCMIMLWSAMHFRTDRLAL